MSDYMTEIERIKEVVEDVINTGNFTRLLNLIKESEGELVNTGISKWLAKTVLSLITTIESQEAFISDLQGQRNRAGDLIREKNDYIESLKAITELAVKTMTEIATEHFGSANSYSWQQSIKTTLSEIEGEKNK